MKKLKYFFEISQFAIIANYVQNMSSENDGDDNSIGVEIAQPVAKPSRKQIKSSRKLEENLLDKAVRQCSKGERHCRACAKGMDHNNLPHYVKCLYCGSVHGFYRVRTGRQARERIYLEDRDGKRVPKYNANGDFAGYRWRFGEKMYYDDGETVPETTKITACSNDACKFFKISIKEVEKYDRMTGGQLDKI